MLTLTFQVSPTRKRSVGSFHSPADKMDKFGRLKVGDYLEVKGLQNVYAIGDCNDLPEIKLAYQAGVQGGHVADNLTKKYEGKEMKQYKANGRSTDPCTSFDSSHEGFHKSF